tara:strand:+ start:8 stop:1249 length:1242 start_codon:yes stop_codon:yes gene_type:complete
MASNLTNINAALKYLYLPRLQSVVNTRNVLSSRLQTNTDLTSVSGRSAVVPINIRPSQAIGARADEGALPTPQQQTYVECQIPYKYNYATIRITHQAIAASRNDEGSFIRVISSEMEGIERDLRNDMNRQHFGAGEGSLGTIASADNSANTITMDSTTHQVKTGMVIDVWQNASGSHAARNTALTVNSVSGAVVTVAAATISSIASTDWVTRTGSRAAGTAEANRYERMGLEGIVNNDTGTFQNISRNTYPEWKAQVFAAGGTDRAITANILDDALLTIEEQGEGTVSFGITNRIQYRKIADLMTANRRYTPGDQQKFEGGFTAIEWGGVPIVFDRDCHVQSNTTNTDDDVLYLLDEDTLGFYELSDFDFDDEDGDVLHRQQGYAYYDATLFKYGNMGCTDPGNNGVIKDLTR